MPRSDNSENQRLQGCIGFALKMPTGYTYTYHAFRENLKVRIFYVESGLKVEDSVCAIGG